MIENQNGNTYQEQPATSAREASAHEDNGGDVLPRGLKAAEVLIGLWTAMCLAIAGGIWGNTHFNSSVLAFFFCASISGLYLVYLVGTAIKHLFFVSAVFFSLNGIGLGFSLFGVHDNLVYLAVRFSAHTTTILKSQLVPTEQAPFWFVPNGEKASSFTPTQLIIGLIIENEQARPSQIVGYGLDWAESPGGPWYPFCAVDSLGSHLFWAYDPANAVEIDADDYADRSLLARKLAPFESAHVKTAWECPGTCKDSFLRLTISEADGVESRILLNPDIPTHGTGIGEMMRISGKTSDLTHLAPRYRQSCLASG